MEPREESVPVTVYPPQKPYINSPETKLGPHTEKAVSNLLRYSTASMKNCRVKRHWGVINLFCTQRFSRFCICVRNPNVLYSLEFCVHGKESILSI
jgi:xylose isomerase